MLNEDNVEFIQVLILILLEDSIGDNGNNNKKQQKQVLILILLEDSIGANNSVPMEDTIIFSLNPYFIGR